MSWHFLQEQVAEYLAGNCSDGNVSALSKLIPTAVLFCLPGSETESLNPSLCGMTLRRSTGGRGAEALTWYRGASPVRTYLSPARESEFEGNEVDSGPSSPASLARYNPVSYGWRTSQLCLFGGLESFLETFPAWGMMRSGELFPLPTPERLTCARESGFWPTPNVPNGGRALPKNLIIKGKKTPTAYRQDKMWPTPHGFSEDGKSNGPSGSELGWAVNRWPTPTSSMMTEGDFVQAMFHSSKRPKYRDAKFSDAEYDEFVGGSLNPTWVEWLMGWPLGWTDLRPLEMAKFRQWLRLHGVS